ncbi:MAG: hypothetical protein K0S31_2393 [Sphingobacterium multivorum]|jgi:hypothetical protein|nr:hypothetical protein [Sphingobacterium multivorum]
MAKSYKVTVFAGTKVVADMAQQVKNSTIEASIQLKTVKGGATSATATILPPGPAGATRKMEDVEGWFVNGTAANPPVATGTPWEAKSGFKNTNWWDATTWSLGSSVPIPNGQGLLPLFDSAKVNGYAKDAQVRDIDGISYVSLKDGNKSLLNVVSDWLSTGIKTDSNYSPNSPNATSGKSLKPILTDETGAIVTMSQVMGDLVNSRIIDGNKIIRPTKIMFSKWENDEPGKELLGVQINVINQKPADKIEVAIYDKNYNKIVTSTSSNAISNGWQHFGMPYKRFDVGEYYIGMEVNSNNDLTSFKASFQPKEGFSSAKVYPMPSVLSSVQRIPFAFEFKVISPNNLRYTGFGILRTPTIRQFNYFSGYGLVGYNTATFKTVRSVDNGVTWAEISGIPNAGCYAIEKIGNNLYWMTQGGIIYKSSDITTGTITWTDITPADKNPKAVALPSCLFVWNNYLFYVEYSQTNTGELKPDGGPKIHRYNAATSVWTVSGQFPNARHGHSFTAQGTIALFVCFGDAGWGDQVGYHRITSISNDGIADNWLQWTYTHDAADGNSHYPVSSTIAQIDGVNCLIGGADRTKMFLTATKISNTVAGQSLINSRVYGLPDADTGETMRNAILDARGNFYAVTAESKNKRLICSPPPYIDRYVLADNLEYALTLPMTRSGEFIFFETYRFNCVTFENQASFAANVFTQTNSIIFDSLNVNRFKYEVKGFGAGKALQGNSLITLEAENNAAGTSTYHSLRTELIDFTSINYIKIICSVKRFVGTTSSLRLKTSTDTTVDGQTNGVQLITTASDIGYNSTEIVFNVSSVTGNQYLFFQALASQVSSISLDIESIWLE